MICILGYFREAKKCEKYFRSLLKDRDKDSICSFSRSFDLKKIDTWVVRAVYEELQSYISYGENKFPVRPKDDIFEDLKIDREDFGCGIIVDISRRTGRSLKDIESNPYYNKLNTVENLVYFFNEQPISNQK